MTRITWRGVALIAAVYFYFLLFAQFAFLKLLEASGHASDLKVTMGAMGVAGLIGSLATPLILKRYLWHNLLILGFMGGGLASLCALLPLSGLLWPLVAALIGCSLGVLTVTLVCHLRDLIGEGHWGLTIGAGTGLAYFACNVPWVFQASPSTQTVAVILVAFVGCCLVPICFEPSESAVETHTSVSFGFGWVLVVFTMLIWLDSAAFFVIQNSRTLAEGTWGDSALLWRNAVVHLVAALLAGWWLEKQRSLAPVALAFVILAVASWCVNAKATLWLGGLLYPAGVSLYSTCLVAFPAYVLGRVSRDRRAWLAAILYTVAGWIGSGMGIGMAENLHAVPLAFILVAAILVGAAFAYPYFKHRLGEIATCAALLLIATALSSGRSTTNPTNSVDRGREVYLSEGCIHCHSRYVRPEPKETLMWGPYVNYEEALQEKPPLFGNRRQGPDLMNVGLRRSRAWMKQHFIEPRSLASDSVMPNYEHLFNDERGEALLDYLMQPRSSFEKRVEATQAWQVPAETSSGSVAHQWSLYQKHCLACHGECGQGTGPVGRRLARPPANLRSGPFIHSAEETAIPRVIKFGVLGTDMPGHEYLSDKDIAALTAYVTCLRTSP